MVCLRGTGPWGCHRQKLLGSWWQPDSHSCHHTGAWGSRDESRWAIGCPGVMDARHFRPGLSPPNLESDSIEPSFIRIDQLIHFFTIERTMNLPNRVHRNPRCWGKPTSFPVFFSVGGPVLSVFRDLWMKSSENAGSTWRGSRRFIPWTSHTWALLVLRTERVG